MKVLVVIITERDVMTESMEAVLGQDYPNFDLMVHARRGRLKCEDERRAPGMRAATTKYLNCSDNRERARKMALASDADKFLFVDSDIVLPPGAISELAKQNM